MASKARDIADLGSNDVLETTATGLDVTGTVTADGLVVSNAGATTDIILTEGSTNTDARIRNTNGILEIDADINNEFGASSIMFGVDGVDKLKIDRTGDVSFYEDTGTTAKMVWSSSSENLLIGTTNTAPYASSSETGVSIFSNGTITNSTSGTSVVFNTLNDGTIIDLRKDGSTVGSIGSRTGASGITLNSQGADGILQNAGGDSFAWNANYFYPRTDNAKDLGFSSLRFKDLYLSGGIKTGGNSVTPTLVEDNGGIMLRYVVTDALSVGQKTRFTFNLGNRRGGLVKIKAVGAYTASNNGANHPAAEFTVKLLGYSDGNTSDNSSLQVDYSFGYSASNYTFTNNGSGNCTIDIENPTGDPNVYFSYVIEIVNPLAYATVLSSSTTI